MEKSMEKMSKADMDKLIEVTGGTGWPVEAYGVAFNEGFRERWEFLQQIMADFLTLAHGEPDGRLMQAGWAAMQVLGEIMKLEPTKAVIGGK